jgi:hypothetical protein
MPMVAGGYGMKEKGEKGACQHDTMAVWERVILLVSLRGVVCLVYFSVTFPSTIVSNNLIRRSVLWVGRVSHEMYSVPLLPLIVCWIVPDLSRVVNSALP